MNTHVDTFTHTHTYTPSHPDTRVANWSCCSPARCHQPPPAGSGALHWEQMIRMQTCVWGHLKGGVNCYALFTVCVRARPILVCRFKLFFTPYMHNCVCVFALGLWGRRHEEAARAARHRRQRQALRLWQWASQNNVLFSISSSLFYS